MSELKAGVLVTPHNEGMSFHRGSDVIGVTESETEFYLKSEADKVIAELQEKLKEQTSIAEEGWKEAGIYHTSYAEAVKELYEKNKEARHHNYKRCEAMAKWCEAKVYNIRRKPLCDMDDHEGWQHDDEFWQRWHKRWLELAEHFRDRTKMMEAK